MLDSAKTDSGGNVSGTFLTNNMRALILKGLTLQEGKRGAQIVAARELMKSPLTAGL